MDTSTHALVELRKMVEAAPNALLLLGQTPRGSYELLRMEGRLAHELRVSTQHVQHQEFHAVFGQPALRAHIAAAAKGQAVAFEFEYADRVLYCQLQPFDEFGEITNIVGTLSDVTQHRRAETQLQMLAQTLKYIRDAVVIANEDNIILFVNPALLDLFGLTTEDVIGAELMSLFLPNNPVEVVDQIFPQTLAGGWEGELDAERSTGQVLPVYLKTSVVYDADGKMIGIVGLIHDISAHKQREHDIEARNEELVMLKQRAEKKNRQLTHSLYSYARRVQEELVANQARIHQVVPDLLAYFPAKRKLTGNFYWFSQQFDRFFVALVDSGLSGMMGTFRAIVIHNLLNQVVNDQMILQPDTVLQMLEKRLEPFTGIDGLEDGGGIRIGFCSIGKNYQSLKYAGAGMQMFVVRKGRIRHLASSQNDALCALPLGPDPREFGLEAQKVEPGDVWYLYTNCIGCQEQRETHQPLTTESWEAFLLGIHEQPFDAQYEAINTFLADYHGHDVHPHDLSVLGFRF